MDRTDIDELLMGIEGSLSSVFSNFDPETPDSHDGALLAPENVFQRAIVLQPLLCVEVPGFNQITDNIKAILQELTEI